MAEADSTDDGPLRAGTFSTWLAGMQQALGGDVDADVPCGGCTACCRSSQFVHIEPDEVETLARIPADLLFPAPRLPRGHVLLGYDEDGCCPMLVDDACSIYEHRPRTCRTYDCRVFAASGVDPDEGHQLLIARRARRWRFDLPDDVDRLQQGAVRSAARFVRDREDLLPTGAAPVNAVEHAVLAIRLHEAFLREVDATGRAAVIDDPEPEAIRAAIGPSA